MKHLATFLAGWPLLAAANVMTFEPLPPDFADYSSYVEDGIRFGAWGGGAQVFHADSLLYYGGSGTGATFYAGDGRPLQLLLEAGGLFDLVSLDLAYLTEDTALQVTSSNGAVVTFDSPFTALFGPEFADIAWVRLDFDLTSPLDSYVVIDNLVVQPVPETSTGTAGVFVAGFWWLAWRRSAQRRSSASK